jgi:hypothetical protein
VAGVQTVDIAVPAVDVEKNLALDLRLGGESVVSRTIQLKSVRPLQIFLLPHSHVDIGYTALQADVEKKAKLEH